MAEAGGRGGRVEVGGEEGGEQSRGVGEGGGRTRAGGRGEGGQGRSVGAFCSPSHPAPRTDESHSAMP